jgi:hypothetical protein
MEELVIGDKTYIPSKKAAEITGYAKDYIGQLCREGRVEAKLVGRSWYVLESSIREHRFGGEGAPEEAPASQGESVAEPATTPVTEDAWESPTYVAEPLEEVIPKLETTYVENKPQIEEKKIADLQQSWEAWFSRPKAEPVLESVHEENGEVEIETEAYAPAAASEIEERPISIHHVLDMRAPHGRMDIAPAVPATPARPVNAPMPAYAEPRRSASTRKGSGMLLKAAFVAFVVIVAAVSAVGAGFFETISGNAQFAAPIIDFIGGVDRVSK